MSQYASFEPLPEDQKRSRIRINEVIDDFKIKLNNIVRDRKLIALRSDYLNMSQYFLDPSSGLIYEAVTPTNGAISMNVLKQTSYEISEHLRQLNRI